jgi:hypothetical protein
LNAPTQPKTIEFSNTLQKVRNAVCKPPLSACVGEGDGGEGYKITSQAIFPETLSGRDGEGYTSDNFLFER